MYIKVYFNDKPLFLTDSLNEEIEPYRHHDDAIFVDEFSPPAINSIIHEMKLQKIHAGILLHNDFEKLKKSFIKKFTVIRAAGGLVLNPEGQILFIFRRGKWDLLKGKVDPDEEPDVCGEREVKEETGLKEAKVERLLITTYHTYEESGKHILKETDWFLMKAADQEHLEPQVEEQISDARWVSPGQLRDYTSNTYLLIKDVLREGGF